MMQERQRANKGHTHDPWPCCGEPPDDLYGRPKGGICYSCRKLIDAGKDAIARQQASGESVYRWTENAYWWPRYYGEYAFGEPETGTELSNAMYELVETATSRIHDEERRSHLERFLECHGTHVGYQGSNIEIGSETIVRTRFNELDKQIRRALTSAYAEGKARGHSLLLGLAAGRTSLADFEKHLNEDKDPKDSRTSGRRRDR